MGYITEIDYSKCNIEEFEQDIIDNKMEMWSGFMNSRLVKNGDKLYNKRSRNKIYHICRIYTKQFNKQHKEFINTLVLKYPKIGVFTFKLLKPVLCIDKEHKTCELEDILS
jgi:hypothetical protein